MCQQVSAMNCFSQLCAAPLPAGEDDGFMTNATFEALTTAKAASETNKGNALLNFEALQRCVAEEVMPYLNIYCFDNAALGEGEETHELLLEWMDSHENEEIKKMANYFGVRRRPIILNVLSQL